MRESIRYPLIIFMGFLFGIFVFLPINEFVSYFEYHRSADYSVWQFIIDQLWKALSFKVPVKFFFYMIFGGSMGLVVIIVLNNYRKRNHIIFQLRGELDKSLESLIQSGENDNLEFKSSFRYDYKLEKVNKALEAVIIKTLAGFMNARGGTLLIGVDDSGQILGLEADYNSLARKDNDGFTQLLMTSIANKMGTPACRLVRILFHQKEDKEVCRVIVLPSTIPIYVMEENQTHFYIRTASGTREMDVQEAIAFIKTKWG